MFFRKGTFFPPIEFIPCDQGNVNPKPIYLIILAYKLETIGGTKSLKHLNEYYSEADDEL